PVSVVMPITPAPGGKPAASSVSTSASARRPGGRRKRTNPVAGKSRPTAKPPARSPRTFKKPPNSPNCSPTPRSWRPATTRPTAAPGGTAVSERPPPRQLPVPGNSPADQLAAPTGQYDVDGRICEANVARSLLLRKIDEPPQSPPVQAVRARPF